MSTLKVTNILLNRISNPGTGMQWYSPSYNAWVDYMGNAGVSGQGPSANLTPVAGAIVTSWARRSFIENAAGYGWTFESGLQGTTSPAIMAEISSTNGNAKFLGEVTSLAQITAPNANGKTLRISGSPIATQSANIASIAVTGGNIHIDPTTGLSTYLNYYSGTGGIYFGNGAGASVASVSSTGVITAPTFSGNATTATTASNLKGGVLYASSVGTAYYSAVQVREANAAGAATGAMTEAPRLAFHWGGRVASSIAMENSGRIAIFNNPGSGYEDFAANNIYAAGNVTAYSDERLKTNWRDLPTGFVENLAKVKVGIYDRLDLKLTQVGVSAQSLKNILPNAVNEDTDVNKTLSVNYGNAALVSAIELAKEFVELKLENTSLKLEIEDMKNDIQFLKSMYTTSK